MNSILIVEDNYITRRFLRSILQDEFKIIEASNGVEALDLLKMPNNRIVAVVLDIIMPVLDGFKVLEQMQADSVLRKIPVIVSTGSEDEDVEIKALSLGASDFISKPYNVKVIKHRINNMINLQDSSNHISELHEEKEVLRSAAEQYRIAAFSGGRKTARYDIKTAKYYPSEERLSLIHYGDVVNDVPRTFIEKGAIAPECISNYLEFYRQLANGAHFVQVDISIKYDQNTFRWFHTDATVIFDDDNMPSYAIFVYTDVTEQREKETVYLKWKQSLRDKNKDSFVLYCSNLSRNESFESMEGTLFSEYITDKTIPFDIQTKQFADKFVYSDDRKEYLSILSTKSLMNDFRNNKKARVFEFREISSEQGQRWIRLTVELVEYPNSSEIEAYLMFEDIDEQKRMDIKAKDLAERDPLTGVYNRLVFAQRVAQTIQNHEDSNHAFLMLDVDGFKQLNDAFGHAAGDQALIDIASSINAILSENDIVGRLGGDEFVVFMSNVNDKTEVKKKARKVCMAIQKDFNENIQISASIGVALYPDDGKDFEQLYRCADSALYCVKNAGKNNYSFYDEIGSDASESTSQDTNPRDEHNNHVISRSIRRAKGKQRILIVDDDDINRTILENIFKDDYLIETAFDGQSALLSLRHFGASISLVLLDIVMPRIDGFALLQKMQESFETKSIPVIIVSAHDEHEISLAAIKAGAVDFVTKPVDPEMIKIRVQSALSKADSERLRAQNSYLLLQSTEEAKYRTVLDSTGTVVIEFDWVGGEFIYDNSISKIIAGTYDDRRLWQILLSDLVADTTTVQSMQELVRAIADDRGRENGELMVRLKTPKDRIEWFRMRVFKRFDEFKLTNKLIITFVNINDEVLAEERLHYQAERDELTGLWNRKAFFNKVEKMIISRKSGFYVMSSFDIDGFKAINDQYGSEKGDDVLKGIANIFQERLEPIDGIVSRITADSFAVLYPASYMNSSVIKKIHESLRYVDPSIAPISYSIGQYIITDTTLSVSAMYDRAVLAQSTIKGRFDESVAQYDESMRDQLLQQQMIINEMNQALQENQFEIWFQPQLNHATKAHIGAEVLVRWRHPQKGIIMPSEFIPVFEKNGFIYEMDKYVWEQACKYLRKWLDENKSPAPISVNISRYDLLREDLCSVIKGLVKKYSIPPELLHLEITESAFAKNTKQIIDIVKQLISYGFTVEIDDFGSGYSSLNTLKDVPTQVMKMDMRFLENSDNSDRGGNILESVVRMAKWLGMSIIAEGVETLAQADYLKSIGCNYMQGFFYAKPMTANEYEMSMEGFENEERLFALETVENFDNNSFWSPESMDTLIFNTYVGGACIFEWNNEKIEVLRVNNKYAQILGNDCTAEDCLNIVWEEHMDADTLELTKKAIMTAIETGEDITYEAHYENLFGKSTVTWLRTTLRVIAKTSDRSLLFASSVNLDEQHEAEQKEKRAMEQLRALNANLENMIEDMPGGYARLRVLENGDLATEYVNGNFCRFRGMTREQIIQADSNGAMNTIHPDDLDIIRNNVKEMIKTKETRSLQYRLLHADGSYISFPVFGRMTENESGEMVLNAYYPNMTESEKQKLTLRESMPFILSAIMKSSSDLSFAKDKDFKYLCCSHSFAKMLGLESEEDVVGKTDFDLFDDKSLAEQYRADDLRLIESGESMVDKIEPIPTDDKIKHFSTTSKYILRDTAGNIIGLYGTGRDVTEDRNAYEQLKLLTDSIPGGLATYVLTEDGLRVAYFNDGLTKLFGCTREEYATATRENVITTVFEEDVPRINKAIQCMLDDGTPVNCTYRIHNTNDEGYKWINLRATPAEMFESRLQAHAVLFDVTEQKLAEEAALVHESEMRFVISQFGKVLCEYTPSTKTLTVPESFAKMYGISTVVDNVPETLITSGVISEETVGEFASIFDRILKGLSNGSAEYRDIRLDGSIHWEHAEFFMIFDLENKPIKAIITIEDITQQHEKIEMEKSRHMLDDENLLIYTLYNLTTGELLNYSYADGRDIASEDRLAMNSGKKSLERVIGNIDEREKYMEIYNRDELIKRYEKGETEISFDYRRRLSDNSVIWARNIVRVVKEPVRNDLLLFGYCYNIEEEKTKEMMANAIINESFEYIVRVDMKTKCYKIIANAILEMENDIPSGSGKDFDKAIRTMAKKIVHEDDKADFLANMLIKGIMNNLNKQNRYQCCFRARCLDGSIRFKTFSVSFLDRERAILLVTRQDITDLMIS